MLIDTNILIAYLDGDPLVVDAINLWFIENSNLFISVVTYAEVLSLKEITVDDITKIRQFLENFILVEVNKEIGEKIAHIRRNTKLKLADSVIIATAEYLSTPLVSRDRQLLKISSIQSITL
jgi:predicted nucleic acid-binding protein